MRAVANNITYARRKADGLCVNCGKLPAAENSVYCEKCREMHRTVNRMYRVRLYYKRQENHECAFCGVKLPPDRYYVKCEKCLERDKAYQKKLCTEEKSRIKNDRRERQLPNGQIERKLN